MGINTTTLKFILYAKREFDLDFSKTATLGRQSFQENYHKKKLIKKHSTTLSPPAFDKIFSNGYCEHLLEYLGAYKVDSFDYSDYENATYIVDMNKILSKEHKDKYTLLIDSGTSEHVFNIPVIYKNMMDMVKIGGHIMILVPATNWCGHGFYQFSPELFYSLLSLFRQHHDIARRV